MMTRAFSPIRPVLAVLLSLLVAVPAGAQQQAAPKSLTIVIIEGDGAINNVRQRVAREPIVQVEDENRKPVAGALVTFALPGNGPGATFANGANTFTAVTGPDGRASASGLKANSLKGEFQMRVTASLTGSLTATKTIRMVNAGAVAGLSTTAIWAIVLLAGAGAAAGIALGMNSSSGPQQPGRPPVTITPGAPVVTPPR
ncbi:MAG: carboxypeptidase regulatory-like domain-containing protein [Candidatus Solibacter usitatus]|nr:carboxypeptidase regulatory-like domain-containing protein [Candidatus Solibacter usitatus]